MSVKVKCGMKEKTSKDPLSSSACWWPVQLKHALSRTEREQVNRAPWQWRAGFLALSSVFTPAPILLCKASSSAQPATVPWLRNDTCYLSPVFRLGISLVQLLKYSRLPLGSNYVKRLVKNWRKSFRTKFNIIHFLLLKPGVLKKQLLFVLWTNKMGL